MAELAQGAEVYEPRTLQVWRALVNWLTFLFQIFVQIVPSLTRVFSYVGIRHRHFKPLPVVEEELSALSTTPDAGGTTPEAGGTTPDAGGTTPEAAGQRGDKLTVVLDLDETLVCAYETTSLPGIIRTQAAEAGLKWFELECVSSDKECDGKPKINYVTVFERPGLRQFLKELGEFADLVLFTAGLEGYARPLVDRIDVENRFRLRLYRPSTISTEYREHVKDLSCISKDLCRTVIVDNNPFSFLLQPVNGIPCIPFSAGQPHDEQLLDVILPLLKQLSQQKDVRPMLYDKFHMPEWFLKHGIPATGWTG